MNNQIEKLQGILPEVAYMSLRNFIEKPVLGSLIELHNAIEASFNLSNVQRCWLRYWIRNSVDLKLDLALRYSFGGAEEKQIFIVEANTSNRYFAVAKTEISKVGLQSSAIDKILHYLIPQSTKNWLG